MQTFGDFLGFNPHCHILVTDGCFYGSKGAFRVAPPLELKKLEAIFRHKVFRMLLNKRKITKELIAMLSTWRHSGFNVSRGKRQKEGMDDAIPCILEPQGSEKATRCKIPLDKQKQPPYTRTRTTKKEVLINLS